VSHAGAGSGVVRIGPAPFPVIKGVPNQGLVCFVSQGSFSCFVFCVSGVCSVVTSWFWFSIPVVSIA